MDYSTQSELGSLPAEPQNMDIAEPKPPTHGPEYVTKEPD
jgi:hypothetical protein